MSKPFQKDRDDKVKNLVSIVVVLIAITIRAGSEASTGTIYYSTMRHFCPQRTKNVGVAPRIAAAIAIACFVAITGCGEPTGPRTVCCVSKPVQPEPSFSGLAVLAAELHDAADVFAQGVEDKTLRGRAELAVNRLADQLLAEKVASSRAALAQARSLIAGADDISAIELAPVGLALDYIERRIDQIIRA
jgi:hypothetical protein